MSVDEKTKFIIIKDSKYGLGLFYSGEEEIEAGQEIFSETPFFKAPHFKEIRTTEGSKYITDCAVMAYYSLIADDEIKNKLKEFKIGKPSDEFQKNITSTYEEEIKILRRELFGIKIDEISDMKEKLRYAREKTDYIKDEIMRMALYRLSCNSYLTFDTKKESFVSNPYEWGFFEFATRANHSCDPNMEIVDIVCEEPYKIGKLCGKPEGEIKFRAIKKINKGDELTYSYIRKAYYIDEETKIF